MLFLIGYAKLPGATVTIDLQLEQAERATSVRFSARSATDSSPGVRARWLAPHPQSEKPPSAMWIAPVV